MIKHNQQGELLSTREIYIENLSKKTTTNNNASFINSKIVLFGLLFVLLFIIFYLSTELYQKKNKQIESDHLVSGNLNSNNPNSQQTKDQKVVDKKKHLKIYVKHTKGKQHTKEKPKPQKTKKHKQPKPSKKEPSKSLINFLKINKKGQDIIQAVYTTKQRQLRTLHNQKRLKFINKQNLPFVKLARYNLITKQSQLIDQQKLESKEYQRLEKKFKFESFTTELPMCILSTGFNNNAKFRIEINLNSIFTQNYTNYLLVIVNDASTDGSGDIYKKYLQFYNIPSSKYKYVENKDRKVSAENIHVNAVKYCGEDSILVIVDGDDELLGRNVLKTLNAVYQKTNSGVVYTNNYLFDFGPTVKLGFSEPYNEIATKNNIYRQIGNKASHLRSYRTELIKRMDPSYLKYNGKYIFVAADMALSMTIMEMSCGRVKFVDGEVSYLYHITGSNVYFKYPSKNKAAQKINDEIRKKKKPAKCDQIFQAKMKKLEQH